jgi:hypothetical protein
VNGSLENDRRFQLTFGKGIATSQDYLRPRALRQATRLCDADAIRNAEGHEKTGSENCDSPVFESRAHFLQENLNDVTNP